MLFVVPEQESCKRLRRRYRSLSHRGDIPLLPEAQNPATCKISDNESLSFEQAKRPNLMGAIERLLYDKFWSSPTVTKTVQAVNYQASLRKRTSVYVRAMELLDWLECIRYLKVDTMSPHSFCVIPVATGKSSAQVVAEILLRRHLVRVQDRKYLNRLSNLPPSCKCLLHDLRHMRRIEIPFHDSKLLCLYT